MQIRIWADVTLEQRNVERGGTSTSIRTGESQREHSEQEMEGG